MIETNGRDGLGSELADIRDYYERNTAWFDLVRRRRHNPAIHRPVWADGVTDPQAALDYVHGRIAAQLDELAGAMRPSEAADPLIAVDLGCGFGATSHSLAAHLGARGRVVGLTISPQQARLAQAGAHRRGLSNCYFMEGDFQAVPLAAGVDAVCSVEAFAHAFAPARYLADAARMLRPGGRLILCDDFRVEEGRAGGNVAADPGWIALFRQGWHIPRLHSVAEVADLAASHGLGLIHDHNLTPYVRKRSFPARLIPIFRSLMAHCGSLTPTIESILGGFALEAGLRSGLIEYRFVVFERWNADQADPRR